jgi:hypothetical protein
MRRKRFLAGLMCVALLALVASAEGEDNGHRYQPPTTHDFGLLGFALRDDMRLRQGGFRNPEGEIVVTTGDRVVRFNGERVSSSEEFTRVLYGTEPGQQVEVEFERRNSDGEWVSHTATIQLGDRRRALADVYRHVELRERGFDWREHKPVLEGGPLRERVWPLIEQYELQEDWDALAAAHSRELDLYDAYESTSAVELLLTQPLAAHQFIEHATDAFAESARAEELALPHEMLAKLLDTRPAKPDEIKLPEPADNKAEALYWWSHAMDYLLGLIDVSQGAREAAGEEAWSQLDDDIRDVRLTWPGQDGHERLVSLVHRMRQLELDYARALANLPAVLAEVEALGRRYWEAAQAGGNVPVQAGLDMSTFVDGDAMAFRSSFGLIAVGGPGDNVWRGGPNTPAVIIDLGGNNEFINVGAATGSHPVSIIITGDGNDRFRSTGPWGVGAGRLGTSVILNKGGNNIYECPAWGIGAAFGGIGLVIDLAGNDRYLGGDFTIGCAAYGVGGVIDLGGNDLYDADVHSIGSGQPGGVGFVLDAEGDDRYLCGGKYGSGYGTEGEYRGWGIGVGYGWRWLASGGTGMVIDLEGNDIYDVGEFGLGCGYYLGIGLVRDYAGDDIYHSSRYGLATGAHCAVGLFMDDSGNDIYEGKTAASMAGVWDIVTGYFYDGGGDDFYRADGLALGASSQNGFGIFWDHGGDNVFRAGSPQPWHGRHTVGRGGPAEYAGGRLARNFGIFLSTGGGNNQYPREQRSNNMQVHEEGHGIFVDE